jgi:hypothetical protein
MSNYFLSPLSLPIFSYQDNDPHTQPKLVSKVLFPQPVLKNDTSYKDLSKSPIKPLNASSTENQQGMNISEIE